MRDYMMMAHYTDSAIGTLLSYLRSRPDYDRTLIVITGDHEGLAMDRAAILDNPDARGIVSPGQYTPLIVVNSPVGDDTTPFSDRPTYTPPCSTSCNSTHTGGKGWATVSSTPPKPRLQ